MPLMGKAIWLVPKLLVISVGDITSKNNNTTCDAEDTGNVVTGGANC
jgi:hypothetical protein